MRNAKHVKNTPRLELSRTQYLSAVGMGIFVKNIQGSFSLLFCNEATIFFESSSGDFVVTALLKAGHRAGKTRVKHRYFSGPFHGCRPAILAPNHYPSTYMALPGHSTSNYPAYYPGHSPAIPVGGGAVVTNDWCITTRCKSED